MDQTTQYHTYEVYLMSFSWDSCQEIEWFCLLSRNLEEVYQHKYPHGLYAVMVLQMESILWSNVKSLKLNE